MNKLLLTLIVPSLEERFDIWVPDFLKIQTLIPLFTEALADLTQHQYVTSGTEILCRKDPDIILHTDYTLKDYGFLHGDQLYLF